MYGINFDNNFITDSEEENSSISKVLNEYDSKIATVDDYGEYKKIGCNCQNNITSPCLSSFVLESTIDDDDISFVFYIHGRNDVYGQFSVKYSGSANHVTQRNFINPLTLTFLQAVDSAANTLGNENNIRGLTVVIENGNTYADITQTPCYLVPRNPICEGGKEPDSFLIEFTDDWMPGYMIVKRPVYVPTDIEIYECRPGIGADPIPINDCYLCNTCTTDCENQDWSGPVGSFVLTKVDRTTLES